MTFSLTVRTAQEKTDAEQAAQLALAKLECKRRIEAVADATAQSNLLAAIAVGGLDAGQLTTFGSGVLWISQMRATWPTLGAVADVTDDSHWPAVPAGVAELAALF